VRSCRAGGARRGRRGRTRRACWHKETLGDDAPEPVRGPTEVVAEIAGKVGFEKEGNSLELLQELNTQMYSFSSPPQTPKKWIRRSTKRWSRGKFCRISRNRIALVRLEDSLPLCKRIISFCDKRKGQVRPRERRTPGGTRISESWRVAFDHTNNRRGCERHVSGGPSGGITRCAATRGVHKGEAGK